MFEVTFSFQKKIIQFLSILLVIQGSLIGETIDAFSSQKEIERFLHLLAAVEEREWHRVYEELDHHFPKLFVKSSIKSMLSQLKNKVLETDDISLIKLFNRAVRNHDALSKDQSDPIPSYYKHYEPPSFLIPDIHLTFDIKESKVVVISDLMIKRCNEERALILDGKNHVVKKVFVNGKRISKDQYKVTPHELILLHAPKEENFQLTIQSEIDPFSNDSLEGMYSCGQWLTTQCESEGARRIFFTLDRPDVLSRIKTTIIADPTLYPYRLSNGDLIEEKILEDGRAEITWEDPFPKPSYLFACVLGEFSQIVSHYTTKSGKEVELQVYVEPGKESRADYAIFALKKAMEFDELLFDREYDLSCLKMVGIPDFNSGAMENKGLMIFNDVRLLVDSQSGIDRSFREVAHVVAHEYFHNWSGNRVTVRNWFEIALKEAFTDLRAMLFSEWLFGAEFIRPKAVLSLREHQFPEETSEKGHPIIVESYVDAHSIYDGTTYTKGREVFRALKNYMDMCIPNGFREAQNLYFSRYDGQAVTFKELLSAGNEILKKCGKDLTRFERWFHQQGTPKVEVRLEYDEDKKEATFLIEQSCPHPRARKEQHPFQIPFSIELLGKDGTILFPKMSFILEEKVTVFKIPSAQKPTPVFMHGYSAPVILHYPYTFEDLACIVKYSDDAFNRWEAAQNYSISALKELKRRIEVDPTLQERAARGEIIAEDLYEMTLEALKSSSLSPLAKAQVLELPTIRILSLSFPKDDFETIGKLRDLYSQQLALACKEELKSLLLSYPSPSVYEPSAQQMQIRELRYAIHQVLILVDEKIQDAIFQDYQAASNFDDCVASFHLCLKIGGEKKEFVIKDFYEKWKGDKAVFNFWLSSQVSIPCSVDDIRLLESVKGYDRKNPNHVRSIFRSFVSNLRSYHDSKGEGYRYLVDKILEVGKFNPLLAHNYLAVPALLDFERLSPFQQALMAKEMERLREGEAPPQTRDLVERMLGRGTPNSG